MCGRSVGRVDVPSSWILRLLGKDLKETLKEAKQYLDSCV